ncbi:hypothetical protein TNCV_3579261 [Trichonephila clavipes]|nr:hypothetical protein TNCV_3579261 [Trichonephila clavipes]
MEKNFKGDGNFRISNWQVSLSFRDRRHCCSRDSFLFDCKIPFVEVLISIRQARFPVGTAQQHLDGSEFQAFHRLLSEYRSTLAYIYCSYTRCATQVVEPAVLPLLQGALNMIFQQDNSRPQVTLQTLNSLTGYDILP